VSIDYDRDTGEGNANVKNGYYRTSKHIILANVCLSLYVCFFTTATL